MENSYKEHKELIINKYNELGNHLIDEIYMFGCLKGSGFDEDKAYKLIPTLRDLWLKDENNYGISKLSDMLYNIYDEDIFELTTREMLATMYENDY